MRTNGGATSYVALAAMILITVSTIKCGSDSPAAPSTGTLTVSSVTLSAPTVPAGGTGQATVSLTAAAPAGGSSIALSTSNPAVAMVPTPVLVPAGSSSATFAVTGVSAGTATIAASLNGSTGRSPMLTVTAQAAVVLRSISLSAPTVVGGEFVTGTAILNAVAPDGGAVVSLSAGDPAKVPASITVPAGLASATFTVTTRAVGGATSVDVTGSYGGASASATLAVTPPTVATARFGVRGPTESDTCTLMDEGKTLNCTFDGTTSTAPGTIAAWDWSYGVAGMFTQTTSGPVLTMPAVNCSLLPPPPFPEGPQWFTMIVTLKIHDSLGNVSAEAVNRSVRVIPKDVCGF
jgi:hypothetical protein